jgi:3',5'-cyclic AMP phosphodiesterase CpdA
MKLLRRAILILAVAWGGIVSTYAKPLYFVQITDTHIGGGGTAATRAAIESISELPVDLACVVHTGDITADALGKPKIVAFTKELLATINSSLLLVPGNHDLPSDASHATIAAYTNAFGPLIQVLDLGDLQFVSIYTEPLTDKAESTRWDPLSELKKVLEKDPEKPTIICHHSPSVPDFYKNKFRASWPKRNRAAWRKLLNSYNVKAVLCGHVHRGEQHWLGDIPIYVGPAIVDYWNRTPSYRLYIYEKGLLSFYTIFPNM